MKRVALLSMILLLVGCSEDRTARSRVAELEAKLDELTKQTTAIKDEHAEKISELVGETRRLGLEMATNLSQAAESKSDSVSSIWSFFDTFAPVSASVDPSKKGFSVARNKFGSYLVLLEDVQPYLDGHKLKLRIGNLTAATLTGVTVKVSYGPRLVAPQHSTDGESQSKPLSAPTTAPAALAAKWKEDTLAALKHAQENADASHALIKALTNRKQVEAPAGRDVPPATWVDVDVAITPSRPEDIGALEISMEADGARLAMGR